MHIRRPAKPTTKQFVATPLALSILVGLGLSCGSVLAAPAATAAVQDLGLANPALSVVATVWVKGAREAGFDAAVRDLYDPTSAAYHQWMTSAQIASYAPTADETASVQASLAALGLKVAATSEDGAMIRVTGRADKMQAAFGTTLHQLQSGTKTFFKATSAAKYKGTHAELVGAVSGLSGGGMRSFAARQMDFLTGMPVAAVTPQAGTDPLATFTAKCFTGDVQIAPKAFRPGQPTGTVVSANYAGEGYLDITTPNHPTCGLTAKQVVAHYGIDQAHALGWTGKGQTIVIVDAYGSPTIASDANTFSQVMDLPAITSKNFEVVYSAGAPATSDDGWASETTLDVEWAHALAPDARIVLVVAPSEDTDDLAQAVQYAVHHHLGDVISNSWGLPENESSLDDATMFNNILRKAAARGIAVNVATGDSGDNGVGSPVGAPIVPADSPFATAVGGTSVDIPTDNGVQDTAWGVYASLLAGTTGVANAPITEGFTQGGGGGESVFLVKPGFQRNLPGTGRQTPDISALADPQTGAIVMETDPSSGKPTYFVVGGTSLATPIFSAIWALADQAAGESLGQAAPVLGKLPAFAIRDILPISGKKHNVSGSVTIGTQTTNFLPYQVLGLNPTQRSDFVSALIYTRAGGNPAFPLFSDYFTLGFGLDSSLEAAKGWDNATGYGEPNGLLFIDSARYFARPGR
jgi:subtilase family serine protease